MKWSMLVMLFVGLLAGDRFSSASVKSIQVIQNFQVSGVARCPCPASMSVFEKGNRDYRGYIANDQKVETVEFEYVDETGAKKTLVLNSPQLGIRSYYGASEELAAEIKKKTGKDIGQFKNLRLVSFSAAEPTLYKEPGNEGQSLDSVPKVWNLSRVTCAWESAKFSEDASDQSDQEGRFPAALLTVNKSKPECKQRTQSLPGQLCAGMAVCGPSKERTFLVCEASQKGSCPPAHQCKSPGYAAGNPNRLSSPVQIEADEAKSILKERLPDYSDAEFVSGARLGKGGFCGMEVNQKGTRVTITCLPDRCGSLKDCASDDPCVTESRTAVEAAYSSMENQDSGTSAGKTAR